MPMHNINPGDKSYAFAKACGIIGKSFVGKRIKTLESVGKLSELDKMVFPDSFRDLPEKELLINLENRIISRTVNSIISIVKCFDNPPEFLILLLRVYEYADLKSAILSVFNKEAHPPTHTDLGNFQTLDFSKWPDITAMLKNTEFSFLLKEKYFLEQKTVTIETALDIHYYKALWKSLFALPGRDRAVTERILSDEISLKNSCLALRLRTYYSMSAEKIKTHLIDIQTGRAKHSLAADAVKSLRFPLDDFPAWSSWRWRKFLNTSSFELGSGLKHWQADPRYFQNAASRYLYRLAKKNFHFHTFSLDSIFCYIKLKLFEEDILTSVVEGLNMGMSSKDIFSMMGIEL